MSSNGSEVDCEVFDPTGQGVEVVDADFARKLAKERDESRREGHRLTLQIAERDQIIEAFRGEIAQVERSRSSAAQAEDMQALAQHGLLCDFGEHVGGDLVSKLGAALVDAQSTADEEAFEKGLAVGRILNNVLTAENARLREIFPKILTALGGGEVCGCGAAVEFLENIPSIVEYEFAKFKTPHDPTRNPDAGILRAVAREIDPYIECEECSLLDALRLIKFRLRELEAREGARRVRDAWGQEK